MNKINIGTLRCRLFGHVFVGNSREYTPSYLKDVEKGIVALTVSNDFYYVNTQTNHCVRCGINRDELK